MVLENTLETSSEHLSPRQTFQTWFITNRLVGPNLELVQGIPNLYIVFSVSRYYNEGVLYVKVKGLPTQKGWESHIGRLRFPYLPPFTDFQLKCGFKCNTGGQYVSWAQSLCDMSWQWRLFLGEKAEDTLDSDKQNT